MKSHLYNNCLSWLSSSCVKTADIQRYLMHRFSATMLVKVKEFKFSLHATYGGLYIHTYFGGYMMIYFFQ